MAKIVNFSIKAKKESSDIFRSAFAKMGAEYTENIETDNNNIIAFEVRCSFDKINILKESVPLSAYASIGLLGM